MNACYIISMPQPTKILLIEDDESLRLTLRKQLEKLGHHVTCASNGKEGLVLYHQLNPGLTITDIMMEGRDGLEVLWEIRSHNPQAKVIVISAEDNDDAGEGILDDAEKMSATAVLKKSITWEKLTQCLDSVLD